MDAPRKAEPSQDARRIAVELVESGDEPAEVAAAAGVAERSVWRWLAAWAVAADFPRLSLDPLPPYAPELNPVEPLWKHVKLDEPGNFVPADVPELDRAIRGCLDGAKDDQVTLKSFFTTAHLPWDGLTRLF